MTRETYERIKAWARSYYDGVDYLLSRIAGRERLIEVQVDDGRQDDDPLFDAGARVIRLSRGDLRDLHDFMCEEVSTGSQQETGAHVR